MVSQSYYIRLQPYIFSGILSSPAVLSSLAGMNINWFSGWGFRLEQEMLKL
jgi:hypothetical protein